MFGLFLVHLAVLNGIFEAVEQLLQTTRKYFAGHLLMVCWNHCDSWETPASTAQGFGSGVVAEATGVF